MHVVQRNDLTDSRIAKSFVFGSVHDSKSQSSATSQTRGDGQQKKWTRIQVVSWLDKIGYRIIAYRQLYDSLQRKKQK